MHKTSIYQLLGALFWLVVSVFVCVKSFRIDVGTFGNPGPGFFPFWVGLLLGLFSLGLISVTISKNRHEAVSSDSGKSVKWYKVLVVLVLLLAYTILLPVLGYLLVTFGLLLLLFSIVGSSKLYTRLIHALIITVVTFVIFNTWLDVQLPNGILDISSFSSMIRR